MSTLKFPYRSSARLPPQDYVLTRVDMQDRGKAILAVHDLKPISHNTSIVYRASMTRGSSKSSLDVVCKVRYGGHFDRLREEAEIYHRLTNCQGSTIPRCYGLFEGKLGKKSVSCLVLEYCGERLETLLSEMGWNFKFDVLDCLMDIHNEGVQHNDFAERNVVVRDGKRPFIVDFELAIAHDCGMCMEIVFHDPEPCLADFGCRELHSAANKMLVWEFRTLEFLGMYVDVKWASTPEDLAKMAPKGTPEGMAMYHARSAIQRRRDMLKWRAKLPM